MSNKRHVLKVLYRARDKISQGWIKGMEARDENGAVRAPESKYATSWCVLGSISAVARNVEEPRHELWKSLRGPKKPLHLIALATFNDKPKRRKVQVLALFARAIRRIEQELRK